MLRAMFNRTLDQFVRTRIFVFGWRLAAFRVGLFSGVVTGSTLMLILAAYRGLSLTVTAIVVVMAILTFFVHALLAKLVTGSENMAHYRHLLAVVVAVAVLLGLIGQPVLPYLDLLILGAGLLGVCGRIGCLLVGCCYGRPHRWGVCYRAEHVEEGFPAYLEGVRLFPIQLVEALWLFVIVLIGSVLVVGHQPPGTALVFYLVTYAAGRFTFEFMRGDIERPYLWDFSEAQWTSLLILCVVATAESFGALPFQWWHLAAGVCMMLAIITLALTRHSPRTIKHHLLRAGHLKEVAEVANLAAQTATDSAALIKRNSHPLDIRVGCTSLGIQISASRFQSAAGYVFHYALSARGEMMTEDAATTLAELIRQLQYPSGSAELLATNRGVFHFLIRPRTNEVES